jgi:hypothetical protein
MNRHAASQSSADCAQLDTGYPRPIGEAHRLAAVGQFARRPLVAVLVLARDPATVFRLVVAIVVATFDLEAWRARPHVFEESLERTPPASAHANTSAAVAVEFADLGVVAPLLHVAPGKVFGRVCHAVGDLSEAPLGPSQATAVGRFAASEAIAYDRPLNSATAPAEPVPPRSGAVQAQDVPGTEVLVGQISEVGCTHLEIPGALGARLYHGGTP